MMNKSGVNHYVAALLFVFVSLSDAVFDAEQLTTFLNEVLQDPDCIQTAALTVGVVINEPEVEFAITLGERDVAKGLKADKDTLFGIGSTTKAMTAIVTNEVLKDFGYTWDTPIISMYPDLKFPEENITQQVTFRDLYSHRTCLSRSDFWWSSGPDKFDVEDMMSKLQFLKTDCDFRSKFRYNNLMYVAGAYIIEQISGKPWFTLVDEILLTPLEMTRTKTTFSEALEFGNRVKGYDSYNGEFVELQNDVDKIIDLVSPAGSVYSTAADMNKYLKHILEDKNGTYAKLFWETEIIDIGKYFGVTERLTKPTFPATSNMDNYTISWTLGDYQEEEVLVHGGDTFTTHSLITLSRDRGYSIFSSTTGGMKARSANQLITWFIQDMINGKTPWINSTNICTFPGTWNKKNNSEQYDSGWSNYVEDTSDNLAELAGVYSHRVFGNISISFHEDDGLYFQYCKVNCTLRRLKSESKTFRCHANVPYYPADTRISQTLRILDVRFEDGSVLTNMMESSWNYTFNKGDRTYYSLPLLLVLSAPLTGL